MRTLLIVDDDDRSRYLLKVLLSASGFHVEQASSGVEALERARKTPPDMIISDILMPGMDGFTLCRSWKQDERLKAIPFVFYTATYTDEKDRELALELGAEDFLRKPMEPEEFVGIIQGMVQDAEKGTLQMRAPALEDETVVLKHYNERLVRKLEKKMLDLEREIVERRRMEERLRSSEEKYRDLVENLNDTIYTLDRQGIVTYVSPAIEALAGYRPSEIMGKAFTDFVCKDDIPFLLEAFRERMSGRMEANEYRVPTQSGETRWVRSSSRPFYKEGRVEGLMGVMTDITESKNLQAQLLQSQKMEAVGRLTGGIAHDFNNMLAVIIGYGELLLMNLDEQDPVHQEAANILKATERARQLTKQLLAFSRKQVIHPVVMDLNEIVENTERMLRQILRQDIELTRMLEPALWRIRADRGQIEQVIMNLAVNAQDAMPGGGKLSIETSNVTLDTDDVSKQVDVQPGPYVRIAVSDTGTGMDAETRKHMFEPFFTTKEMGRGTGLGLATVYGIVKQSRGHIGVYTEPRKGTTIEIYLPCVEEEIEEVVPSDMRRDAVRGSETILVVEDDDDLREMVRVILQRNGYQVLDAANAGEAILHAEGHAGGIHLMLTDMVMPKLSGRELADRLAQRHPDMKVLYMSGYTDNNIVYPGEAGVGSSFIEKPFHIMGLLQKVREVLDTRKPTEP